MPKISKFLIFTLITLNVNVIFGTTIPAFHNVKVYDKVLKRLLEDTLEVYHSDTSQFLELPRFAHYPCSKPKVNMYYELIDPNENTYYYIYNTKNQLSLEGKYTFRDSTAGIHSKNGGFYNSRRYYYKKSGVLESMHSQDEGRNSKTEFYDKRKRITKIKYYNRKSGDLSTVEIYRKAKLKETRTYNGYRNYTIVKAIK